MGSERDVFIFVFVFLRVFLILINMDDETFVSFFLDIVIIFLLWNTKHVVEF